MEDFLTIQPEAPVEQPQLYQPNLGAPAQGAQQPAGYDFLGPQFDSPTPQAEGAQVATTAGGSAAPGPTPPAGPNSMPGWSGEAPPVPVIPGQQVQPPNNGQTQPPVPTTPPVTTPPVGPTVDPMANQTVPGWQGNRPEFLIEGPPNMPGPTDWNVTDEQTVGGQMANAQTNRAMAPVYERMRSNVVRAFLSRGGKNSLRAQQAAEMVVVETAFKVAAADAQVFARSAEFNAATRNQFGAAQQRFMHEAMLSDQSYKQAKSIQELQIAAEAARATANAAGGAAYGAAQLDMMQAEQDNWIERAAISHRYNVEIIGLQNSNERGNMRLANQLGMQMDTHQTDNLIRRDTNAANLDLRNNRELWQHQSNMSDQEYRQTWSLAEQSQGHQLERFDRQTDNAIREREVAYGHQTALNYQSEVMQNLRGNNALVAQILSTPGLTGAQQQEAIRTIGRMTATTDELIGSFYTNLGVRPGNGTAGSGGLAPYNSYNSYGNPYVAQTAPTAGQGGSRLGGSYTYPATTQPPPLPGGG